MVRDEVQAVWDDIGDFTAKESNHKHAEYPIGVDEDASWHEWLLRTDKNAKHSALRVLRAVRHSVEKLPPYKAMFRGQEVYCLPKSSAMPTVILELCGSWEVPDFFSDGSGQHGKQFVNPNHSNASYYTEVFTRCECGALMHREVPGHMPPGETQQHTDDCLRQWRLHARARLCEKRRAVAERCIALGHSIGGSIDRLGLHNRSSMGSSKEAIGVREADLTEQRRALEGVTFARAAHFYDQSEIGDAFDYSRKVVGLRIKNHTDTTGAELRRFRQQHGYE